MSLQEAQDESIKHFSNLLNKDILQQNIINSALVLLVFETLKDLIINNLYDFSNASILLKKDKDIYKNNEKEAKNDRKKENKYFEVALEWFQKQKILSACDVEIIVSAKKLRKDIAHNLFSKLAQGLSLEEVSLISQVQHIYKKLVNWWINAIETDINIIANLQKKIDKIPDLKDTSSFQVNINIIISVLFILIFESLKDLIIEKLRDFYCNLYDFSTDKFSIKESKNYAQKVRSLNPQNIFYASLQWFQNYNAICDSDVEVIKQIEKCRNDNIVHNYFKVLTNGLSQDDLSLLPKLFQIYDKLDSWWIYNIETDWDEIPNSESVDPEMCHSMDFVMILIILDILNDNGDKYADWPEQIRAAVMKSRSQAREKENG